MYSGLPFPFCVRVWNELSSPSVGSELERCPHFKSPPLLQGHCVSAFKWDSGSSSTGELKTSLPTDAEIVLHIFVCFFDVVLPPVFAAKAAAAPAPTTGLSSGLFGGGSSSLFGASGGFGTRALCGGSAGSLSTTGSATIPAKTGVFWRTHEESCAFSTRHLASASDEQLRRSDVVMLHHVGGSKRRAGGAPLRYSLLCEGVEWAVVQGEHNVWECLVLFLVQRAKHDGLLGGVDLQPELYTSFMTAMMPGGVTDVTKAANSVAYHGLLSVLHPWSQQLQDVDLREMAKKL